MAETKLTTELIRDALRKVQEPEIKQDLVSLNMIRDIVIDGNHVKLTVMLTTPACPYRDTITQDVREVVQKIPGVESIDVKLDADVPSDGRIRSLMKEPVRNAVAVSSGKGGVGKTTVAVNVAVALAQTGARVGLLDADIYGPNIPIMMGVESLPPLQGENLVPAEAYGVKIMSIGFLVKPEQPLIWRGPMLHKAIQQFLSDVLWGELDYLIVDLPPGTGDAGLSIAQSLPLTGGVIVTLPQQVSLDDARRGLEMFRQLEVNILGVVENMSYLEMPDGTKVDIFGTGGGEKLATEAGVPFIGSIPIDPKVREGGDDGKPVVITDPETPVAIALRKVAEDLAAKISVLALDTGSTIPIELVG